MFFVKQNYSRATWPIKYLKLFKASYCLNPVVSTISTSFTRFPPISRSELLQQKTDEMKMTK